MIAGALFRLAHPNGIARITPVLSGGKKFYRVWIEYSYHTKTLEYFEKREGAENYLIGAQHKEE